jgi:hypothetical protein
MLFFFQEAHWTSSLKVGVAAHKRILSIMNRRSTKYPSKADKKNRKKEKKKRIYIKKYKLTLQTYTKKAFCFGYLLLFYLFIIIINFFLIEQNLKLRIEVFDKKPIIKKSFCLR